METEELGLKIKALRKSRGLTQDQLADRLGVRRATISNYEIGRRTPHLSDLRKLAEALGTTMEYFAVQGEDVHNLIARARMLFENEGIPASEKAKIYKEIMRLYLELEE